jgi:hypothetical protein
MSQVPGETALDRVVTQMVTSPSEYPWLTPLPEGVFTSLDLSTPEGRMAYMDCQQEDCQDMSSVVNTEIAVRHVLLHPAKSERPEGGEMDFWTRAVLFLSDGRMIACGSLGVLKSLRLAATVFGRPPWPGLRGKVVQQQLGDQKRWYVIKWDGEQTVVQGDASDPPAKVVKKSSREGSQKSS